MARSSTPAEQASAGRGRAATPPPRAADDAADLPLFVGSIAKCFAVLEALNAAGRPVALTELASLARLERSAVQRVTHTLSMLGYLRQHVETRAFTIAPAHMAQGSKVT